MDSWNTSSALKAIYISQDSDESIGYLQPNRGGPLLNSDGTYVNRSVVDQLLISNGFYEGNIILRSEQYVHDCEEKSHEVVKNYIDKKKLSVT